MLYSAKSMEIQESSKFATARRGVVLAQAYSILCLVAALATIGSFDRLTSVLFVLSTFLFFVVTRYSARYLGGDPAQPRFLLWLCLTSTFVFALVLSANLLTFVIAWCGISLSLHQLLQFYKERPGALLAARKKFLISRLGDAALVAAVVLTHRTFGTWEFRQIFAAVERLESAGLGDLPPSIPWICVLLVFAALSKSAQFPFHSWLPDTMETPTPVSALMHAGIINAGGILIIRLAPLVALSGAAMHILVLAGGFTAIFASSVMQTQSSIKRFLAFSTIAQMGFMMLECGLGAVHLAVLHLVAHSLYKAHAFLSSGEAVGAYGKTNRKSPKLFTVLSCIGAALALGSGVAAAFGVNVLDQIALKIIFSIALAQMFWETPAMLKSAWRIPVALASGVIVSSLYFALERIAEFVAKPVRSDANELGLGIAFLFLLVAVAQTQLPHLAATPFGRKLYVHARNGFYVNTLANRFTASLWPVTREGI